MNNQFIQRVIFDWNRIDNDSYLKEIEAFKGIEKLDFNKPITFFVGENGSGKSTLLEALAVAHGFNPEGGTKNYAFSTHDTHSELCDAIEFPKAIGGKSMDIFSGPKVFIMLQRRKKNMQILRILLLNIMKGHMERVFSR